MAFISCRSRLTIMLADAIKGKKRSRGGGCWVRLPGDPSIVGTSLSILISAELKQLGSLTGDDQIYNAVVTAHALLQLHSVGIKYMVCHTHTLISASLPPPLPFSPLAALACIMINLLLQLMKVTVLTESSCFLHFHSDLSTLHGCLQTWVR